ncbi:MAG TPA: hypothetical protein VJ650_13645 [Gemmatimonadaceae bacterium]|nr:hypothetical protein [Gemmatimonadaceae bacterium]
MRRVLAAVGCIAALTSCSSYYPVRSEEQLAPASTVTVTFASPRDLEATHEAAVYALPAVEKVYGKVERASADTLVLRVLLVESHRRQPELPEDARLTVVPDPTARVAIRRLSSRKTNGLIAGVAVIGAIAIFLATLEFPAANPSY